MTEIITSSLNHGQTDMEIMSAGADLATPRARCTSFAYESLDELLGLDIDFVAHDTPAVGNDDVDSFDFMEYVEQADDIGSSWNDLRQSASKVVPLKVRPPASLRPSHFLRPSTPVTHSNQCKKTTKRKSGTGDTSANESKIESHRLATAKRARANGRFQACQIDWVNISLLGEKIEC